MTDKTDSRHVRTLLAEGRLPECWVPPAQILEYRALLETYHDLRQQRRRPKSRHTDGSGYAGVYLHGPCTGT